MDPVRVRFRGSAAILNSMSEPREENDLLAVRDLISNAPLQRGLMADLTLWHRLCDGLDGIQDGATPADRLAALNAARECLGMDPAEPGTCDADADAAVEAGVVVMRATLEERVNEHYQHFVENPLSAHLTGLGYGVEKLAEAVRGTREDLTFDQAIVQGSLDALRNLRDGIIERGYDADVWSDVDDAISIFERGLALLDHAEGAPARRDAELLTRHALPKVVRDVESLAAEIDAEYRTRRDAWDPS